MIIKNHYILAGDNCLRFERIREDCICGKVDYIVVGGITYVMKRGFFRRILSLWVGWSALTNKALSPYREGNTGNKATIWLYNFNIALRDALQKAYLKGCVAEKIV